MGNGKTEKTAISTVKIHEAKSEHLDAIYLMCTEFHKFSKSKIPLNKESLMQALNFYTDSNTAVFLVATVNNKPVGFIITIISPYFYNFKFKYAQEVMLWVTRDYRNKGVGKELLLFMSAVVKELGCSEFMSSTITGSESKLYTEEGFSFKETVHSKEF